MKYRILLASVCVVAVCLAAVRVEAAPRRAVSPERALQRKVARYSVKASLGAALADYAQQAGVKVRVDWKALDKTGVTAKKPMSVSVEKVTYKQLLEVMLARAGKSGHPLGYRVMGGEIVISTHRRILVMESLSSQAAAKLATKPADRSTPRRRPAAPNAMPSINFNKLPFRDALRFFKTVTKINFHVNWRSLEQDGIDPDTPITLNVRKISVARALDLVFDQVNAGRGKLDSIYWVVDRGVVLVASGNTLNRKVITRVIDAGSALMVVPDMKGPRIELDSAAERSPSETGGGSNEGLFGDDDSRRSRDKEQNYAEMKEKHRETIIEIIKKMIGDEMWQPDGQGDIKIVGNKLIISQSLLGFKLLEDALR